MCRLSTLDTSKRSESSPGARRGVPAEGYRGGHHEQHQRPGRAEPESPERRVGDYRVRWWRRQQQQGVLGWGLSLLDSAKRGLDHTREPPLAPILRWWDWGRCLTYSEEEVDVPVGQEPKSRVLHSCSHRVTL